MTQNSEAGTPRDTIKMDDSRRVQKSGGNQSRESENDWRRGERAKPNADRPRHVARGDDREPKPFLSHEDKLAAMEGSWKKKPDHPARPERRQPRDDRSDRYDRQPREDRSDRYDRQPREERHGSSRAQHSRDNKDHRPPREYYADQPHGGGISEHVTSRNSWPGDFRGAKSRSKESMESFNEYMCPLAGKGATHLINVLDKEFLVCPRQDARVEGLPNLKVAAAYLIEYVVENLEEETGENGEDCEGLECLIYGGEARAIVASEYNVEDPKARPTDLDLRFRIGKRSFESCRNVVEQFLLGRLMQVLPKAEKSLVRSCYFQKQVVVSSQFSLLSIGDPKTGRNLDLEFTSSECQTRCFFDDANAFVIPLPDPANRGWRNAKPFSRTRGGAAAQEAVKLMAKSQSAPWQTAVDYIRKGQINIDKPETVFNGLPLYAHALSDKQLVPGTRDLEQQYGSEFARAFIEQAEDTYKQAQDPLRFLKSFLRSHYPSRPVNALACLSQVLAILRAHAVLEEITPEREAIAKKLAESLAELCREALQNASNPDLVKTADVPKNAVEKVLQIVRFAANPFTDDMRRDEKVVMDEKRKIVLQLRRQMSKDNVPSPLWEDVCKQAAELMLQKHQQDGADLADSTDSRRADVDRVCDALKGLSAAKEISADSVEEQSSQTDNDGGSDQRSAVASCKSLGMYSSASQSSLESSRSEDDDSRSSISANEEAEHDFSGAATRAAVTPSTVAGSDTPPAAIRKSPPVQVDVEASVPASASASPHGTPNSASSRTPNSERKQRPNWGSVYRPPARRSNPSTPQS